MNDFFTPREAEVAQGKGLRLASACVGDGAGALSGELLDEAVRVVAVWMLVHA